MEQHRKLVVPVVVVATAAVDSGYRCGDGEDKGRVPTDHIAGATPPLEMVVVFWTTA